MNSKLRIPLCWKELIATHEVEAIRYLDELGERRPDVERKALADTWAAARRTGTLQLNGERTRWYREAERLADRLDIPLDERAKLVREHAAASWGPDIVVESERVALRAIEILGQSGDDGGVGWAYARLVLPLMQLSRHDEAEAAGKKAIEMLEPLGDTPELADALHRLGWFYWRRGQDGDAEPLLRRSVEMAKAVGATEVHAGATQTLGLTLGARGNFAEGSQLVEEAFRLAKQVSDSANLFRAYNNVASVRAATEGPAAALDVLKEGLELALRNGIISNAGWIAGSAGDMLDQLGRLHEAAEYHQTSVDLAKRVGDAPLISQRVLAQAANFVARGRIEEGRALRDEAAPLLGANPEKQANFFLPWVDAYLAYARHDRQTAADLLDGAAAMVLEYTVEAAPEMITEAVRALMLVGAADRAAAFRDSLSGSANINTLVHARNVAGLLEADADKSIELLRNAADEFHRLQLRIFGARAEIDLARAMVRLDQDASEILARARSELLECDAQLFLYEVDEVASAAAATSAPTAER